MEQDHHGMEPSGHHQQQATADPEPDSGHGTPQMTDGGNVLHSDSLVVCLHGITSDSEPTSEH